MIQLYRKGIGMKLIKFFRNRKHFVDIGTPMPVKQAVPEWYRKAESTYFENGVQSPGLKKCMPYMDALLSGYVLTLPADVYVSKTDSGDLSITWNGPEELGSFIAERPKELGATMPRPAGHYENHLVWSGFWGWKTPRGYSSLLTHPLNRFDLPFTTTSGIVDSDKFWGSGNIPFFIKEDFVGVIPAGTPIAQIIPIKRKSWKMIIDSGMTDDTMIQGAIVRNEETPYKKVMWQRKEYN